MRDWEQANEETIRDYEPIDISGWRNVGEERIERSQNFQAPNWPPAAGKFPYGKQEFHGLPFLIEHNKEQASFIGFGNGGFENVIELSIDRDTHWVILAHRLLEMHIYEGESVGQAIARYEFLLETNQRISVPIRGRFEIVNEEGV